MATAAIEEDSKQFEEYDNNLSQYSYSEESKKALKSLQTAFDKKDFQS